MDNGHVLMSETDTFTVLVCGGREYADWTTLHDVMGSIHHDRRITKIIHGCARGADEMAGRWADLVDIPARKYYADWKTHGKAAGPIRNQEMLDDGRPDLVIAFPGGRGTADMIWRAQVAGVEVRRV